MGKMLGAFAPMGDASMKLFSQMMDMGLSSGEGRQQELIAHAIQWRTRFMPYPAAGRPQA
jgi:hypothetical protein